MILAINESVFAVKDRNDSRLIKITKAAQLQYDHDTADLNHVHRRLSGISSDQLSASQIKSKLNGKGLTQSGFLI